MPLDHGFDEILRKGAGWLVLTGAGKRGWEVPQGAAATVQAVKSVKSREASRKAYREGAESPDLAGHPTSERRTSQRAPQGVGMPYAERPGAAIDI